MSEKIRYEDLSKIFSNEKEMPTDYSLIKMGEGDNNLAIICRMRWKEKNEIQRLWFIYSPSDVIINDYYENDFYTKIIIIPPEYENCKDFLKPINIEDPIMVMEKGAFNFTLNGEESRHYYMWAFFNGKKILEEDLFGIIAAILSKMGLEKKEFCISPLIDECAKRYAKATQHHDHEPTHRQVES